MVGNYIIFRVLRFIIVYLMMDITVQLVLYIHVDIMIV